MFILHGAWTRVIISWFFVVFACGKSIWAAALWQDTTAWLENLVVKVYRCSRTQESGYLKNIRTTNRWIRDLIVLKIIKSELKII